MKNPSLNPDGLFVSLVTSSLNEVDIIFKSELILSESEYPKGP